MKAYPKYKSSNIEWIGEIPENWGIKKLKYLSTKNVQYGLNIGSEFYINDGIRFLRTTDIDNKGNLSEEGVFLSEKEVESNYILNIGDFLISRSGTIGRAYVHQKNDIKYSYAGYLVRFCFNNIYVSKFVYYITKTTLFFNWLNMNSIEATIGNVNGQKYANFSIQLPPNNELNHIVTYLDDRTQKIDALIEKKQKLIDFLKEERTATINQAVTKGLNPDVPMKDSTIEWMGEIPKHWEVKKLKYVANLKSGEFINAENINSIGTYPVLGGNGLRGYTNTFTHEGNYILIGRQGALCGNINLSEGKFYATEHAVVVTIVDKSETIWLAELLHAMNLNQYSQASAQPGLAVESIKNLLIPSPSYKEQKEIKSFVNSENERIKSTILKIENEIALLQEYRIALISEVVTGKIDVREAI